MTLTPVVEPVETTPHADDEWQTLRVSDLADNFDSLREPVKSSDRRPGPYPYYGASGVVDLVDGYLLDGEYLLVSEDGENLRSRSLPITYLTTGKFWPNNHAHVLRGKSKCDTRFLAYAIEQTDVTGYLTGSAQPKLTKSALEALELRVPTASTRQAIAEVLEALDDKIAANTKLATTADVLARSLVQPAAPSVALGEVASQARATVDPVGLGEASVTHYSLPAFDTGAGPEVVSASMIKSGKFELAKPSVLLSKLNPRFPRVWNVPTLAAGRSLASTEFVVLEPLYSSTTVLWALVSQTAFGAALEGMVAGTSGSHQRVKPADILATQVADPRGIDAETLARVESLGLRAIAARLENTTLARTRDALLPALMSGRLRVSDAERIAKDPGGFESLVDRAGAGQR